MQNVTNETVLLGYGGMVLTALGLTGLFALVLLDPKSSLRERWATYEAALDYELRFLMIRDMNGARMARLQLLVCALLGALAFALGDIVPLFAIPIVALAPYFVLRSRHHERIERLEAQLDPWLLMLANALKASPSLGEAVISSAKLMRPPMSEELDLAIKEMKLGTPLDQAVINMSARIGSQSVSSSLATILVGRQTGGDLPKILEESSATLREMSRLEGVVRTKTAEGKTQAYVLGLIPFVLVGAIHMVDENWLRPLGETTLGYTIIIVAAVLWFAAIIWARKILAVDV
jgi:tight adherence protein B